MPAFVRDALGWLQRRTGWSNSRESWLERLGVLGWLLGAAVGWYLSDRLGRAQQFVLAGLWLLVLMVLLRRGWLKLFGPVLFYEVLRIGRQRRYVWLRVIYASTLALVLLWVYWIWGESLSYRYGSTDKIPMREVAEFAETFFYAFMIVQFVAVSLLTPAYTAGAVADEKERKTLEFLLATDLRNREIVFGKLASRVANLTLFLLAGLPVLSLTQFFGGVDPDLLLAGFVATVTTMLFLASLSIFASVVAKRSRDAIALTYLMGFAYLAVTFLAQVLRAYPWATTPSSFFGYPVAVMDVVYALSSGNLILAIVEIFEPRAFGATAGNDLLLRVLGNYILFDAVAVALLLGFAVWRLRAIALRQSYGTPLVVKRGRAGRRPEVGDEPMFWKEVFVEGGLRMSLLGRLAVWLIFALSFVPVFIIAYDVFLEGRAWRSTGAWWSRASWEEFGRDMNGWVRTVGAVVSCLALLAVGIRAAGCVRGERDKQTMDSLLTTPLSASAILWGMWWGCVRGVRRAWAWLGSIWLLGLLTGGLSFLAVPLLVGLLATYAAVFAWVGIWFSLTCRTTLRATVATILTSLVIGGGYFVPFGLCCVLPLEALADTRPHDMRALLYFMMGLSPPVNMVWTPFRTLDDEEWSGRRYSDDVPYAPFVVLGWVVWVGLAFLMAMRSVQRFRADANRRSEADLAPRVAAKKVDGWGAGD